MTYSLAVIMLETTSSVDLFLPIIFTLFVSYGTGALLINKSIYLSALRTKNIPMLSKECPDENKGLKAASIMSAPPICLNFITKVEDVFYNLEMTLHNGFPVTNKKGFLVGLIDRDTLITLVEKAAWYFPEEYRQRVPSESSRRALSLGWGIRRSKGS